MRETEYELRRIKMQSMLGDAKYERRSSRNQMHVIRVNRVAEIGDFDGLSGSPVFQINHIDGRYSSEAFAGMVLRGTATAGTLEFLEHGKVISVLTKIVDGDVKEDTTA
ncbi:hypothetical protein WS62_22740 [Burkholderia sp. ABCPW 14]|nr:hypothetical protein WS62_22740 [Burkholderia sp. ABCPW 14]